MNWVVKNKYWLILIGMAIINTLYTMNTPRFKNDSFITNLVGGTIGITIIFMLASLVIFGVGKVFLRHLNFGSYLKICAATSVVLTLLYLIAYYKNF